VRKVHDISATGGPIMFDTMLKLPLLSLRLCKHRPLLPDDATPFKRRNLHEGSAEYFIVLPNKPIIVRLVIIEIILDLIVDSA
jgi:hypothetical protein